MNWRYTKKYIIAKYNDRMFLTREEVDRETLGESDRIQSLEESGLYLVDDVAKHIDHYFASSSKPRAKKDTIDKYNKKLESYWSSISR